MALEDAALGAVGHRLSQRPRHGDRAQRHQRDPRDQGGVRQLRRASSPISSTKSMHGHLLGAGGGIEAVACIKAHRARVSCPPTIGLDEPDPECDLDYMPNVGRKLQGQLRHVELVRLRRPQRGAGVRPGAGLSHSRRRASWRPPRRLPVLGLAGLLSALAACHG